MGALAAPAGAASAYPHYPLANLSHSGYTHACGAATDSAGNLYVANSNASTSSTITVYDPTGAQITSFVTSNSACNLAVDANGNLYASARVVAGGPVTKYKPSEFPPVSTPVPTTYAVDKSINETAPGADDGNGVIDAGPTLSVAVDPASNDVFASHPAVNEAQLPSFTGMTADVSTFTIGSLPAACDSSTTAPITYKSSGTTLRNNINTALEAACSAGANDDFITAGGSPSNQSITFAGQFTGQDQGLLTCTAVNPPGSCSVAAGPAVPAPSYISQYNPDGTQVTNAIGTGLTAANYTGIDVYSTNGRVFAFDANHKQIAIFNPGAASPNSTIDGSTTPAGSIGVSANGNGLAVDQNTGHVFVFDGGNLLVAEFKASGEFVTQMTNGLVAPTLTTDIAVNSSGGVNDGVVYVADKTVVQAFAPMSDDDNKPTLSVIKAGPGAGTVAGGTTAEPSAIDCGSTCDVGFDPGAEVVLTATADAGSSFEADSGWSGCDSVDIDGRCHVTINANTAVTATFIKRILNVSKSGSGAGTIDSNPAGIDCGSTCQSPFDDGGDVVLTAHDGSNSKFKAWSGCDSVDESECTVTMNSDRSVNAEFAAEPAISATEATGVGSAGATLKAKVNPKGNLTTWHFEYVDDANYQATGFDDAISEPAPDLSAGSANGDASVSRAITGLAPSTTYHFRLVATNFASPPEGTAGAGETFTTYAASPAFGSCPNDQFRTGASAKLPDCRAYEQASPLDKNGSDVGGALARIQASPAGDAISFFASAGLPGGVGAGNFPLSLGRRVDGQWSTVGLLPPAGFGETSSLHDWLPDFSLLINSSFNLADETRTLLARDIDGTHTVIASGFKGDGPILVGASDDGSIIYLAAPNNTTPLAPGAVTGKPNLYAWNRDTNTLVLAGVLPNDACTSAPCVPAGGSQVAEFLPSLRIAYPIESHLVSESGDAYFTDAGTGILYLHKNPFGSAETVAVSASQRTDCAGDATCGGDEIADPAPDLGGPLPATFHAATSDGGHAFFTSAEELTDTSNTGPPADPPGIARADLPDALADPPCDVDPCNIDKAHLSLISTPPSAMIADGEHLYWIERDSGAIGRSDLEGSDVDQEFIPATETDNPKDLTVFGNRLYWTNAGDGSAGTGSIGDADLNGADPATNIDQQGCLTGLDNPRGIAIRSSHIYWTSPDPGKNSFGNGNVGRALMPCDQGSVSQKFIDSFVSGDIVVNASDIYVSFFASVSNAGNIFRFDIDSGAFLATVADIGTASGPASLVLDDSHLYWTEPADNGSIARADLPSSPADPVTNVTHSLVTDLTAPVGIALGQGADSGHLYWATGVPAGGGVRGKDLYRYDSASGDLTDLTPDDTAELGADVRGVLGASADGEYVYFVANADLDGEGNAEPGDCSGTGVNSLGLDNYSGECNLYLYHDDEVLFVARLDTEEDPSDHRARSDANNWLGAGTIRSSRVSADGKTLIFRSQRSLTGYDTTGPNCVPPDLAGSGYSAGVCPQLYRYDVDDGLSCISCNPTGAAPFGRPSLGTIDSFFPPPVGYGFATRNLSTDGDRIFFETPDKLLAADTNGTGGCRRVDWARGSFQYACQDVYMWEDEGKGSCEAPGGCLYLLSTGNNSEPSFFADASADGDDAFIFTREQLVPQDTDELVDVYDASVGGGLAVQYAVAPPPCDVNSGGCEGARSSAPQAPGAGSAAFQGQGNPREQVNFNRRRCPKGKRKVRRGGEVRCVKRHIRRQHKKQQRNRAANHDRRASR